MSSPNSYLIKNLIIICVFIQAKANIYDDKKVSKTDTSNATMRQKGHTTDTAHSNRESSLYQTVAPFSENNDASDPVHEDNAVRIV